MSVNKPFFSIIIPTFNRGNMIQRAVDSCLRQQFRDFEIIIVDDASTDNTHQIIQSYTDKRIVYLQHDVNRGVCEARNTAIEVARGKWYLMLDSDFELIEGALYKLHIRAKSAPNDIGNLASTCLWDSGLITPCPTIPEKSLGYEEYLSWFETVQISEWFNCFRSDIFNEIRYPVGRVYEASFHLAVMRRWKLNVDPEPLIIFHTDANNRITAGLPHDKYRNMLRDSHDSAADSKLILKQHGYALRAHSPTKYYERLYLTGLLSFLSGNRKDGFMYMLRCISIKPSSFKVWAVMILGIIGRKPLALVKARL